MDIEELKKLGQQAGLNKQEIKTLVNLESLSKGITEKLARFLVAKTLVQENQTPFMNPTDDVKGIINFAASQDGKEIGIFPNEPHMLIVGMTRSGKTTLLLNILLQILGLQNE